MSTPAEKLLNDAIVAHQKGSLKKADTLYRKLLSRHPRHSEALHMRGVLKYQQGNHDYAKQLLSDAQKLDNSNPRIRYHLGDLYRTIGEFTKAEQFFKQAVELGSIDGDVYFMLANTQFEQTHFSEALENYLKAVDCTPNDPDYRINLANCYESLNAPDKAVEHLVFVANGSNDQAIHLQLIEVLTRAGSFLEASERISLLPSSSTTDITLLIQTINTLLEADRGEDASRLLDIVMDLDLSKQSQSTLALITGLLVNVGRYDDAQKLLDITSKGSEPEAITWFQRGLCEQTSGAFENAAISHRRALQTDPTFGRAAYSLAINGKSNVTDTELSNWQQQAYNNNNSTEEKIQFLFASARTLDARGEVESAFDAYEKANTMHHTTEPFDPDRWDAYIDSVIENFSPAYFNRIKPMANGGQGLIFIVGMPRSGSTLLEYQLTRQFSATALGEHPTIRRLFMDLPRITGEDKTVPQCAEYITADHIDYLHKQYFMSINRLGHKTDDSNKNGVFVDKMLGNFLRLGMLAAMFPDAKVLHCARDAEPTCVSCYTNLFARGLKFTYDLYGLGRAWQSYQRLMGHWKQVLPLSVYDVQYERVVTQPEVIFSEISEFLERPTTPVESDTESGAINTASFYQARQPISTKSLQGWKRFEPYLEPLQRGLGK